MSRDFADFAEMLAQARANYARTMEAARRPDASREEIVDALDLIACRRVAWRALELREMRLSTSERRAALDTFSDDLDRQLAADLAVLLDGG